MPDDKRPAEAETFAPDLKIDTTKLQSEQARQYAQLINELAAKLETSFTALDRRLQDKFLGHARDIEKCSSAVAALERSAAQRFQEFVAAHRAASEYRGPFRDAAAAKLFGEHVIAVMQRDQARLAELQKAALLPTSGPAGGYAMPELLIHDLIRNVEEAGVFEANCPAMPVGQLKGGVPSRTSGATVYYPDYGQAGTASTPQLGKRNFDLKRYIAGVEVEDWMLASELAVPLANYVVTELAYALALAGDTNWFVGDGTSSYCGHTGLFKSGMTNMADLGLQVVVGDSGDDTFAEMIAKSTYYLGAALGKLPLWAHKAQPKWYGHLKTFFDYLGVRDGHGQPIVANILAATAAPQFVLMGYPYVPVQVAPTTSAVSTVFLILAALGRGCGVFRHNAGIRFRNGDQVKFWEEMTVFAASVAQDMVVKDGNAIVQIKTAAS